MALEKPPQIASSEFKSKKWDEITEGRDFRPCDIPALCLLIQWYAVVETCMADLDYDGDVRVAYVNDLGDMKSMPQLSVMKQASAEIRALNKQLGINDEVKSEQPTRGATILHAFQQNRQSKAAAARRAKAS